MENFWKKPIRDKIVLALIFGIVFGIIGGIFDIIF